MEQSDTITLGTPNPGPELDIGEFGIHYFPKTYMLDTSVFNC